MEKIEMDLEKGYRKKEKTEKRDTSKRGDAKRKEAEPAERLGRLSRASFIFSPRLNIKDNLIIEGFSKAGRILLFSLLPLLPLPLLPFLPLLLHLHPLSLYLSTVYPLDDKRTRYRYTRNTLYRVCGYSSHLCAHR